jgi:glycine betaine/choline ABC-type transport system substrate-binding protein
MVGRARPARLAGMAGVALALAACGGGHEAPSAPAEGVAVASFSFAESRLVAEIYAQALEDEGIPVRRELAPRSAPRARRHPARIPRVGTDRGGAGRNS